MSIAAVTIQDLLAENRRNGIAPLSHLEMLIVFADFVVAR